MQDDCQLLGARLGLRSGDAYTTNNFLSFLQDTMDRLKGKKVSLLRADSGFYGKEIFDFIEQRYIKYIIVARHYATIQRKIAGLKDWWTLEDGLQITETTYQSDTWESPGDSWWSGSKSRKDLRQQGNNSSFSRRKGFMKITVTVALLPIWIFQLIWSGRCIEDGQIVKTA